MTNLCDSCEYKPWQFCLAYNEDTIQCELKVLKCEYYRKEELNRITYKNSKDVYYD